MFKVDRTIGTDATWAKWADCVTRYRNLEEAFISELRHISEHGEYIEVRGGKTKELRARIIELEDVHERCLILAGRGNNVFASIAESMWVLSGRNDLEYLEAYLPRAKEFSDDCMTWRGAYGPRLRDWNRVDQIAEIVTILRNDPHSRRAVAVLFDPDRDFVSSKDIPCNNWLHFLMRNGHLDLHVAARSTDIWWGFSGINAFEWSLLLELMSYWLGVTPGRLVFFTSSLHLYERHFTQANVVLATPSSDRTFMYSMDKVGTARYATPWQQFDDALTEWMRLEEEIRRGCSLDDLKSDLSDPLLIAYARMIDSFWSFKRGSSSSEALQKLDSIGDIDLRRAAVEYFNR